jgi:type I restriction enzyme M protein
VARSDFAKLEGRNHLAEVRAELLVTIKDKLIPIGALDEFQTAGVFVNWWQTIRYDLKTITSTGWSPSLIPDSYLIDSFFQAEVEAIEELEGRHNEAEAQLSEAVEAVDYEASDDEDVTPKVIKAYLKTQIEDLKTSPSEIALAECEALQEQLSRIKAAETIVKIIKDEIKRLKGKLKKMIDWKRDGTEEEIASVRGLIEQSEKEAATLVANPPQNKRSMRSHENKLAALGRDREKLNSRLVDLQHFKVITPEESKRLILQKLYDIINNELARYLNAEKRVIVTIFENLWDKYAVSAREIESKREIMMSDINESLTRLRYFTEEFSVTQA